MWIIRQKCVTKFFHMEKMASSDAHWHLELFWRPNSGCEHSEAVSFNSCDSRSPLLVQIFTAATCRLLFIANKNAEVMAVATLKNSVL